jgi:hypothetical protein
MSRATRAMRPRLTLNELRQAQHNAFTTGDGSVEWHGAGVRLINPAVPHQNYVNSQLDDYHTLRRRQFAWRPPLTLHVRARFSDAAHTLSGTAGFGFWNDPFMMTTQRMPTLPRALWFFFASPPSNMALARGVPGHGWKAATIDAQRAAFLALAPSAPIALPLMHSAWFYARLWPIAQRALGVNEALVDTEMRDWHDYVVDWNAQHVRFAVDGQEVLLAQPAPKGPLGLVLWLDNQAMVVTPQGRIRHSLVSRSSQQWLEIETLTISAER